MDHAPEWDEPDSDGGDPVFDAPEAGEQEDQYEEDVGAVDDGGDDGGQDGEMPPRQEGQFLSFRRAVSDIDDTSFK